MTYPTFHKQPTLPGLPHTYPPSNLAVPEKIGPYPVESLLDQGSTSILYLGTHPETKMPTTIKVLSPRYLSHPEMVQRFLNEAAIIAMADHPNIVKLYGYGHWEGGLYIAMEFIQGVSLRQYLLQTPLSLKRALEIVIDIAYALCHLHAHGIIHRDLKPENVLLTEEGIVKVIDFGISQLLTEQEEGGISNQRLIGTPVYMSPEQRENPTSVGYPSDIYSLGIITYELILGKLSLGQIHLSSMPRGIQKILTKSLQNSPKARYQDVVDFISDIMAYLHSTSLQKERKVYDQASEFTESLRIIQQAFSPLNAPEWFKIEVGIASHRPLGTISALYYDFIPLPNQGYGTLIAENKSDGSEGLISIATLRGMIRTMLSLSASPEELMSTLQEHLCTDSLEHRCMATLLVLYPQTNTLIYISYGGSPLLIFNTASQTYTELSVKQSYYLGDPLASHQAVVYRNVQWSPHDLLFLNNLDAALLNQQTPSSSLKELLISSLNNSFTIQQQAETLLRKIILSPLFSASDRTLAILAYRLPL